MIGHMILRKSEEKDNVLGMKVIGGQIAASGRPIALVDKIRPGSIAEVEGRIKEGKFNAHVLFVVSCYIYLHTHRVPSLMSSMCNLLSISFFAKQSTFHDR